MGDGRGFWRGLSSRQAQTTPAISHFGTKSLASLLIELDSSLTGLSNEEAAARLRAQKSNRFDLASRFSVLHVMWNQIKSPLVLILFVAAFAAIVTQDWSDAFLVLLILSLSAVLGFWREYDAQIALKKLSTRISTVCYVIRHGRETPVPLTSVVVGDVVALSAGSLIPGDGVILDSNSLFVDQAVITGESFPVEKHPIATDSGANQQQRDANHCVFFGTSVRSGVGKILIVHTGVETTYGNIAVRLSLAPLDTEFDRGLRQLGHLLLTIMFIVIVIVFTVSTLLGRATPDSLMFAIALAVGLSPELLPAILTVNLSRSSRMLAHKGVLVRQLNAIENLGSMDVLCTDKTGTITEGVVAFDGAWDDKGQPSTKVFIAAQTNASLQGGRPNPLDEALLRSGPLLETREKVAEIPYDFVRKRLTVVVRDDDQVLLITKGTFESILTCCGRWRNGLPLDQNARHFLEQKFFEWSAQGIRVLAVAQHRLPKQSSYDMRDETNLDFLGFLTFSDPPKQGISRILENLRQLGVSLKIITGDNRYVAQSIATKIGIDTKFMITGEELDELRDEALWQRVQDIHVFAQVDPNQKERIILALRKHRHVVGYLGDGINDVPAMHASDVSISVENAADIAKATASVVLLEKNLGIICNGIAAGRQTFANTLKYLLLTLSANLGNMISMAAASIVLPYLPLTAGQILLNNFLSDLPALGLADDNVEPEWIISPHRWRVRWIRHFMLEFGLISSMIDILTFWVLLKVFSVDAKTLQTGWFVESLLSELAVMFVLRSRRGFGGSLPGKMLSFSSLGVAMVAIALPYSPLGKQVGFVPLPVSVFSIILGLTMAYVILTELAKRRFYQRHPF